jgi:4-diphosphocytidyl-2-C-methyl-D-erythritol kinase
MISLVAHAKVNLTLRVMPRDASGLHPIRSLVQSVDLADAVTVALADEDGLSVTGAGPVETDERNLVWRAVDAVRRRLGDERKLAVGLDKRIPVAAGLGGGSADAAAGLVAAAATLGGRRSLVEELAPSIGSDVPFCVTGGTLWVEGYGDVLSPAVPALDHHMALVTAPFLLATADVYRRWDEMEGPHGPEVSGSSVPPSLRDAAPLVNDLTPAALALRPELGDWIADLSAAWGQRALLSGSGPTAVGFFATRSEADDAAQALGECRFAAGASPTDRGWDGDPGGTLPPPPWGVV